MNITLTIINIPKLIFIQHHFRFDSSDSSAISFPLCMEQMKCMNHSILSVCLMRISFQTNNRKGTSVSLLAEHTSMSAPWFMNTLREISSTGIPMFGLDLLSIMEEITHDDTDGLLTIHEASSIFFQIRREKCARPVYCCWQYTIWDWNKQGVLVIFSISLWEMRYILTYNLFASHQYYNGSSKS